MTAWQTGWFVIGVLLLILNVGLGIYNAAQGQGWLGQAFSASGVAGALLLGWFISIRRDGDDA